MTDVSAIGTDLFADLTYECTSLSAIRDGVDAIPGSFVEVFAEQALDVRAEEPPDYSPLLDQDEFIPTPHVGGNSESVWSDVRRCATEITIQLLAGRTLQWLVNELQDTSKGTR